jgi:hypothetical protein
MRCSVKNLTPASPHAWLQRKRLEQACTWLAGGGRTVAEIALWNHASRVLPLTLTGQMIVFETLFATLYGYLWEQRWPTVMEGTALALLVAGVLSCARAHRQQPLP